MFRYDGRKPAATASSAVRIECIGEASAAADVEVIALQRTLYDELGLGDLTCAINRLGRRRRAAATSRRYAAPRTARRHALR